MKTKFKVIVFVISVLYCGITYGQNDFITLTSSQFLKGLDDQDILRNALTENGFTLVKKWKVMNLNGGIYEYWQYDSVLFVDMQLKRGHQNDITLRVYKDFEGLPERLIETFPSKNKELRDNYLSKIRVTHIDKNTAYSLKYTKDTENLWVFIWYDDPFYYFEYMTAP
jgi:hypothetical protein